MEVCKFKLSVYESGYSMRSLDQLTLLRQKILYKPESDFENVKIGNRLNDDADVKQNDDSFDPAEYKETVIVDTKETVTRGARNAFKAKAFSLLKY
jgi:hypothetical protein